MTDLTQLIVNIPKMLHKNLRHVSIDSEISVDELVINCLDLFVTRYLDDLRQRLDCIENHLGIDDDQEILTVVDPDTGLEWEAVGSVNEIIWFNTDNYCDHLNQKNFAGHSDWRIPTRRELYTLVDDDVKDPCIKPLPGIKCQSSYYWSATTYAYGTTYAWGVHFDYGYVLDNYKSSSYYVRAVRGGQS